MKIFAIGDLHLSFNENIDKPMSAFGEGWDNYEQRLLASWRERISEEDTTILAGDLSWGLKLDEAMNDLDWIHELPGQKVLFKGNHDLWWNRITHLNGLYDDMHFIQNDCHVIPGSGVAIAGTRGWILPMSEDFTEHDEKIYARELMRMKASLDSAVKAGAERIIAVLHYPPADDFRRKSDFTDLLEEYPVTDLSLIHI